MTPRLRYLRFVRGVRGDLIGPGVVGVLGRARVGVTGDFDRSPTAGFDIPGSKPQHYTYYETKKPVHFDRVASVNLIVELKTQTLHCKNNSTMDRPTPTSDESFWCTGLRSISSQNHSMRSSALPSAAAT